MYSFDRFFSSLKLSLTQAYSINQIKIILYFIYWYKNRPMRMRKQVLRGSYKIQISYINNYESLNILNSIIKIIYEYQENLTITFIVLNKLAVPKTFFKYLFIFYFKKWYLLPISHISISL